VITNPRTKETDLPNVWAVGDVIEHSQQVAIAMGDGSQAAIWIQKRLRELDAQ
jgi:thioredoxin reductase (NADPH)